jgi:tetratricopeptide (TPR) repeat protein
MTLPERAQRSLTAEETPERYAQLMEEFDAAVELDPAAQRAFLDELSGRDADLARRVEAMLAQDAVAGPISRSPIAPGALLGGTGTATTFEEGVSESSVAPVGRSPGPSGGRSAGPDLGTVVAGRYRVEEVLGGGGGGTVCRARDLEKGGDVAIKFLRAERLQSERGVRRFRREYRAVSRLDHPGCVQAFADGIEADRRYIVMELVRGGDLDSLVGAPTDLVLAVLVQLCVALDYVHSRRIVHRDLKPANVLLVPGDPPAPKIADFGIALLSDDSSGQTEGGGLVGTVDYLSPEQVAGRSADPRSDLYALGCMIFRLWSGRPPFLGSIPARLAARCNETAPLLRTLAPGAPAGLEVLTARLLAVAPADRPQSALEVADRLAALLVETGSPLAARLLASTSLSAKGAFLYTPGMVGRDAELARLVARSGAVSAGAPGEAPFFAICAEGGMGKSTLCRALQSALSAQGYQTVTAAVPSSSAGPLAPFPELRVMLEPLAVGTHAPAARAPRRLTDDAATGLHQEAMSLAELLRAVHATKPLLVLIEDMHHADRSSYELLVELARLLADKPGPRPVLVATLRPEGRDTLLEAAARFGRGPGAAEEAAGWVELEPLDAAGAAGVAAAMLGVRAQQLPPGLIDLLLVESDGSPLLIHSALRALVDAGGALRRTGGSWALDGALAANRSTGQAIVDRLAALSPPTRRVLEVAAAVGRRFDAELLQSVLSEGDDAIQDALDEALRAGVIHALRSEWQRDVFEFDHARLAEAVHHGMAPEARKACHAALGRALAARQAPAVVLARHHALGGDLRAAFEARRIAGHEALQLYDHVAAAALFREALLESEGLPGGTELEDAREDCREGLADALVLTGPMSEAVSLLQGLTRTARGTDPGAKGRLPQVRRLRKLGFARMHAGDIPGAVASMEESLELAPDRVPRNRLALFLRGARDAASVALRLLFPGSSRRRRSAPLLEEAALIHTELGELYRWINLERSVAHHIAGARAAQRTGVAELRIGAFSSVAVALAFIGRSTMSLALERRANRLARATGDRIGLTRILILRAGLDVVVRADIAVGLINFDEGIRMAQATGDRMLVAWARSWRAWGSFVGGRLEVARADFDLALSMGKELSIGWLVADAACGLSMADALQGRFDEAERAARQLLASDVRLALPAIEALSTETLGWVALLRSQYRESASELGRVREIHERHHLERGWSYLLELAEAEALLCLVDEQGASAVPDLLGRLRANARSHAHKFGQLRAYNGCADLLRAVCAARSGQHEKARRLFVRARAQRPPGSTNYIDGWILWRTAFERARMGDPIAELRPLLDEMDRMYELTGIHGLRRWLTNARKLYGFQ